MFSRLKRWLDRLIPLDLIFKLNKNLELKLVSPNIYQDIHVRTLNRSAHMTVCLWWQKLTLLRGALGLKKIIIYKLKLESLANKRRVFNVSNRKQSLEGGITCEENWTNHSLTYCISDRLMPHPAETNWGFQSDTVYNVKNRRHTLRLSDEQIVDQHVEPEIGRSADFPAVSAPPIVVMQRMGNRNLIRYKPLTPNLVDETKHTIKMSDEAVLRKSGVALKRIITPKKRAPGAFRAPPTPQEIRRKMMTNKSSSSKGSQSNSKGTTGTQTETGRNTEGDDYSDSNEDDDCHWRQTLVWPISDSNKGEHSGGGTIHHQTAGNNKFETYGRSHSKWKTPYGDYDPTKRLRNGDR